MCLYIYVYVFIKIYIHFIYEKATPPPSPSFLTFSTRFLPFLSIIDFPPPCSTPEHSDFTQLPSTPPPPKRRRESSQVFRIQTECSSCKRKMRRFARALFVRSHRMLLLLLLLLFVFNPSLSSAVAAFVVLGCLVLRAEVAFLGPVSLSLSLEKKKNHNQNTTSGFQPKKEPLLVLSSRRISPLPFPFLSSPLSSTTSLPVSRSDKGAQREGVDGGRVRLFVVLRSSSSQANLFLFFWLAFARRTEQ